MSRNSNIELLRLICILSIVLWHEVTALNHFFPNVNIVWKEMILSITVPSVNIFILISGYFGLKFKYKKVLYIIWVTLFYSIIIYILVHQINGNKSKLISILMPISSNAYWFITTYIMLILVSPIINSFVELKKGNCIKALLVFTLINVFWGFVFKNPNSPSGYTLIHFVNIYLIGRYLNLYFLESDKSNREINKIVNNVFFISILIFICVFFQCFFIKSYRYNNPIVIFQSILILLFFLRFPISNNKIINTCSKSVLAVYIIHEHVLIRPLISELSKEIFLLDSDIKKVTLYIITSTLIFTCCIIIDYIKNSIEILIIHLCKKLL